MQYKFFILEFEFQKNDISYQMKGLDCHSTSNKSFPSIQMSREVRLFFIFFAYQFQNGL